MADELLIEKCRQQDRKAQMALYRKYCDGMFIIACRYLRDSGLAEDVLQDSFLKAFIRIGQFKGDVTFGAWLKRIVINRCLDVLKAQKMQLDSLEERTLHLADDDQGWEVDDRIRVDEVYQAIEELSEKYRMVAKLYLIEGYDHQEIAEILEISESASRTNLHRAKGMLQNKLKHLKHGTGY